MALSKYNTLEDYVERIVDDIFGDYETISTSEGELRFELPPVKELEKDDRHTNMFLESVLDSDTVVDTIFDCIKNGKWDLTKTEYNVEIFTSELDDDCCTEDFFEKYENKEVLEGPFGCGCKTYVEIPKGTARMKEIIKRKEPLKFLFEEPYLKIKQKFHKTIFMKPDRNIVFGNIDDYELKMESKSQNKKYKSTKRCKNKNCPWYNLPISYSLKKWKDSLSDRDKVLWRKKIADERGGEFIYNK